MPGPGRCFLLGLDCASSVGCKLETPRPPSPHTALRCFPGYRQQLQYRNKQAAEAQIIALPSPEVEVLERAVRGDRSGAAAEEEATPTRWELVVGLSALVALICSVDRAAMSVALGPMGEHRSHVRPPGNCLPAHAGGGIDPAPVLDCEPATCCAGEHFQWSDTVKGQVSSSFFLGYTVTNFVGAHGRDPRGAALMGECGCCDDLEQGCRRCAGGNSCMLCQRLVVPSQP